MNQMKKVIIIGNGTAGFYAAKTMRERNRDVKIVMYGKEASLPYHRPMLTKALLMGKSIESLLVKKAAWFEEQQIDIQVNKKVEKIDTKNKSIVLAGNVVDYYDALIIATGATSFIPPIPGADKANVFAIRSYSDMKTIERAAEECKNVVVIGGGVLGLEAAWQFQKTGMHVSVLELAPKLMVRQLDDTASDLMFQKIKDMGMDAYVGVVIEELVGNEQVEGVRLKDGTIIPADMVIMSTGIRAEVTLAKEAGIEVDRAIVVNERCETNIPDVYAAGDCAQFQGINYGIIAQAQSMGTVAGANALGEIMSYEQVDAAILFHGMNTQLFAIGDVGKDSTKTYTTVRNQEEAKETYSCYYFVDDKLCGAVLYGDTKNMKRVLEAYRSKVSANSLSALL